jgi:CubicO group peptidase (beta-lactamase class C family)
MQGAMFMAPEPWPIVSAVAERELSSFGPPQPDTTPEPDTFMARLGELPLLAQPGERWLYSAGSQVLGVLAARAAGVPFEDVMRERVLAPLGMDDTAFYANDTSRLATAYENVNGELTVRDRPDGQWSRPPRFPDGAAGLVSTAEDLLRFGRMLLLPGGNPVLTAGTVAEMTSDQLTPAQLARVWPGFSFLGDRGWGYGVSVTEWGYSWEGGSGTAWANVPDRDLTVVVLTQRAVDETGLPAVCDQVRTAMSS